MARIKYNFNLSGKVLNDTFLGTFVDIKKGDITEVGRILNYDNEKQIAYVVTRCNGRWDLYDEFTAEPINYKNCYIILKSKASL